MLIESPPQSNNGMHPTADTTPHTASPPKPGARLTRASPTSGPQHGRIQPGASSREVFNVGYRIGGHNRPGADNIGGARIDLFFKQSNASHLIYLSRNQVRAP